MAQNRLKNKKFLGDSFLRPPLASTISNVHGAGCSLSKSLNLGGVFSIQSLGCILLDCFESRGVSLEICREA